MKANELYQKQPDLIYGKICHARMHSLTNFQRIRFVSFEELTQEQVNIWTGTISVQLENNGILLETT